jgi:hypothetical protein
VATVTGSIIRNIAEPLRIPIGRQRVNTGVLLGTWQTASLLLTRVKTAPASNLRSEAATAQLIVPVAAPARCQLVVPVIWEVIVPVAALARCQLVVPVI